LSVRVQLSMINGRVTADASTIIIAGVAVIGTIQTSLSCYFSVSPRKAFRVAKVVTSQEITSWASSAVSGRITGGAVR